MLIRPLICIALLALPASAAAQTLFPLPLPKSLVFPNEDNVLVGKDPSLEGGAFVARAYDASSNIYNAAGLLNGDRSSINASSNGYLVSRISSTAFGTSVSGTTVDSLPGFFGFLFGAPYIRNRNLRFGFAAARTQSWQPPELDQSATPESRPDITRVTYASRTGFRTQLYQLAAAWAPDEARTIRLGLTVGLAETILELNTKLSGLLDSESGPGLYLCDLSGSANEWDVVAGLSAQWDVAGSLTLGARVVGPGVKVGSSSLFSYDASFLQPGTPTSYSFRDPNGAFRYKHPVEAGFGIAYRFGRAQLEADVRYHGGTSQYALYQSSVPINSIVQTSTGTTTGSEAPGPRLVFTTQQVFNIAVGGNWSITPAVKAHAGFYTSNSPVADPSDSQFRQADLYGVTGGADVRISSFGFSLGIGYMFGSSSPTGLGVAAGTQRQIAQTSLTLRALSILYALSYQL